MPDANAPGPGAEVFQPHGHSFLWSSDVLWMHAIADILIALAYFAIPIALLYVTHRRKDMRLSWLMICAVVFLVASGLEGVIKIVAALASLPTAIFLWRSLPEILSLPSQRQLRDANESLARANRELEAFTASVSHDLRSPLTTIAGQAGLLELSVGNVGNDDQKRRLQRIQNSVKQMSDLIDALLVLSRISRHTLHRETVDVSALVENIVSDLRQRDPARYVEVVVQPGINVHGDRRLLSDLFTNLISNAWKFSSKIEKARIDVGCATRGAMATIYVRDNGAGFDMAYEKKLFKPFQRLHGASEFEGSGIGLATVARIVDRHGGRIWAESKPNEGAVFYFTLPTAPMTAQLLMERRAVA
jgi:light-regulated signal transduction histidine kinase (bacteriophytochrome)